VKHVIRDRDSRHTAALDAVLHNEGITVAKTGVRVPRMALRAATSTPARRFGLTDRGRIVPGALADLVLVDGDPLVDPADTLSIRTIWHRGVEFA
jgi:imidazolonepropionase-like amidohydrolase